jgi:hypothetical protein
MSIPYTLDSLLAKQNLFYDECNEVAQTIADEIIEAKRENEEDEDLEEYIHNGLTDHTGDMMTAYADDLINSYGIARAMRLYLADCEKQGMDPYEDEWNMFSQAIVMVIMEEPVVERVKGLLLEYRRSNVSHS